MNQEIRIPCQTRAVASLLDFCQCKSLSSNKETAGVRSRRFLGLRLWACTLPIPNKEKAAALRDAPLAAIRFVRFFPQMKSASGCEPRFSRTLSESRPKTGLDTKVLVLELRILAVRRCNRTLSVLENLYHASPIIGILGFWNP